MEANQPFGFIALPAKRSREKPRKAGLTMMIDDGLPLGQTEDVARLAGDYIDLAKIKTGTARLYPRSALKEKLALYQQRDIRPFIGGQFHEYVFAVCGASTLPRFYEEALALGFQAIEISDNVVPLTDAEREQQIRAARRAGLAVFGEVGSKETFSDPSLLIRQAQLCFSAGAELVLVEAAELVERGQIRSSVVELLARELDMSRVMIELPGPWIEGVHSCDIELMKKQLIDALGPDVNLANVAPSTIIDTEATRVGLGTAGPPKN
jgi:phosphosulfolactate synthase